MSKIKLLISDVDGVMTDGRLIYNSDGTESKIFNVKDGQICDHLRGQGIVLGVITGRESNCVKKRFSELNFKFISQGIHDKWKEMIKIIEEEKVKIEEVAYIGDDINDLPIINQIIYSACPQDAIFKVKKKVSFICKKNGGDGAFREFAEYILKRNDDK